MTAGIILDVNYFKEINDQCQWGRYQWGRGNLTLTESNLLNITIILQIIKTIEFLLRVV